jgi:ribokinase
VLEVPMDVVLAAAVFAAQHQTTFVLGAGPAVPLPADLLSAWPIVCVNAGELPLTLEKSSGDLHADAAQLIAGGSLAVLVTMGADGAEIVTADGSVHIAGITTAEVVDSTGAGDTFGGAVAAFLAAGMDLNEAARRANAAAALSVRRAGAREGMPTLKQLDAFLAAAG